MVVNRITLKPDLPDGYFRDKAQKGTLNAEDFEKLNTQVKEMKAIISRFQLFGTGGTQGQILQKAGPDDYDVVWGITPGDSRLPAFQTKVDDDFDEKSLPIGTGGFFSLDETGLLNGKCKFIRCNQQMVSRITYKTLWDVVKDFGKNPTFYSISNAFGTTSAKKFAHGWGLNHQADGTNDSTSASDALIPNTTSTHFKLPYIHFYSAVDTIDRVWMKYYIRYE